MGSNTTASGGSPGPILGPPRPRRSPLTRHQRTVLRRLAEGNYVVDDCWSCRLEPIGIEVAKVTLRALVRANLVHDPVPLFNGEAGQLTKHGRAWATREYGAEK